MKRKEFIKIIPITKKSICTWGIDKATQRPWIAFEPMLQTSTIGPTMYGFRVVDYGAAMKLWAFAKDVKEGFENAAKEKQEKETNKNLRSQAISDK